MNKDTFPSQVSCWGSSYFHYFSLFYHRQSVDCRLRSHRVKESAEVDDEANNAYDDNEEEKQNEEGDDSCTEET